MVYFTSYVGGVQRILIEGNSTFMRALMLFFVFVFCFVYLVYWKKHQEKDTKFWTLGLIRLLMTAFSYVYIAATPLTLLLFDPLIDFYKLFTFYFGLFGVFATLGLIVLIAEVIYIGPLLIMKMAGMDIKDKRVDKVLKKMIKGGKNW